MTDNGIKDEVSEPSSGQAASHAAPARDNVKDEVCEPSSGQAAGHASPPPDGVKDAANEQQGEQAASPGSPFRNSTSTEVCAKPGSPVALGQRSSALRLAPPPNRGSRDGSASPAIQSGVLKTTPTPYCTDD